MRIEVTNSPFQIGETFPKFKAAAVQAASVFLDREASLEKACRLIREAAENGATFIAFPECFLPGYCYWTNNLRFSQQKEFKERFYHQGVMIPSETTDRLCAVARECGVFVVMGINERDGKSLYDTTLYIDQFGKIVGKHRKFKPIGTEKLMWGDGNGAYHRVVPTDFGRLGSLIGMEHASALPGFALGGMAEQLHVAAWAAHDYLDNSVTRICARHHAMSYNTFVICPMGILDESVCQTLGLDPESLPLRNSWTGIIEPGTGRILAECSSPEQEEIVYADIDMAVTVPNYFHHEPNGHYCGSQFRLLFDPRDTTPFALVDSEEPMCAAPEEDSPDFCEAADALLPLQRG